MKLLLCITLLQVDLLHPLTKLEGGKCYDLKNYYARHCAILNDKVAILTTTQYLASDVLHISSIDLNSWTISSLPYKYMSLAIYKSQFMAVGGTNVSTWMPTNEVFTSDTGLEWYPSLPPMSTKRRSATSISTRSPHVLVVAGGRGDNSKILDVVEVLMGQNWHTVDPLPKPCSSMTATLHQDEVMFTDKETITILKCKCSSLISSCTESSTTTTDNPLWTILKAPDSYTTTITYSSRLVNIDEHGFVRGYCNMSQSWIDVGWIQTKSNLFVNRMLSVIFGRHLTMIVLPNGDLVFVKFYGVFRVKVSGK